MRRLLSVPQKSTKAQKDSVVLVAFVLLYGNHQLVTSRTRKRQQAVFSCENDGVAD